MNKRPTVIISAIIIAISIAGFYFLVIPKINEAKTQKQDIISTQKELDSTTEYFSKIKMNAERLDQANWSAASKKIGANFMSGPFFDYNMRNYFEKLVAQSGLYLKELSIQGGSESFSSGDLILDGDTSLSLGSQDIPVAKISLEMDLSGGYDDLKNLLDIFDKQACIINIDQISITSEVLGSATGEEEGGNIEAGNILNFNLTGNIYGK